MLSRTKRLHTRRRGKGCRGLARTWAQGPPRMMMYYCWNINILRSSFEGICIDIAGSIMMAPPALHWTETLLPVTRSNTSSSSHRPTDDTIALIQLSIYQNVDCVGKYAELIRCCRHEVDIRHRHDDNDDKTTTKRSALLVFNTISNNKQHQVARDHLSLEHDHAAIWTPKNCCCSCAPPLQLPGTTFPHTEHDG